MKEIGHEQMKEIGMGMIQEYPQRGILHIKVICHGSPIQHIWQIPVPIGTIPVTGVVVFLMVEPVIPI